MQTVVLNEDFVVHKSFAIKVNDDWIELGDYLKEAKVNTGDVFGVGTSSEGGSGADGAAGRMTFSLFNDAETTFLLKDQSSAWNLINGQYDPLINAMRLVRLRVAKTNPGQYPISSDWVTLFLGYITDGLENTYSAVSAGCIDESYLMKAAMVIESKKYGSESGTLAETVIQEIMNDYLQGSAPQLYVQNAPTGFMVKQFDLETNYVWGEINKIPSQFGWYLGYRRDPATDEYKLTLMEPPRTMDATTADWFLEVKNMKEPQKLSGSPEFIRNEVIAWYRNSATGKREKVVVRDEESIAKYGGYGPYKVPRTCVIEEADTSLIDTLEEVTALIEKVLHDLKELLGTTIVTLPLFPELDVFHGVVIRNPYISTTDDFYGVVSVEHTLNFEQPSSATTFVGAGRVIGGYWKWLNMEPVPGSPANPPRPVTSISTPQAPTGLVVTPGPGNVAKVEWVAVNDAKVNEYQIWRKAGNYPLDPSGASLLGESAGTWFVDTTGTSGQYYTYYVRAVNVGENASNFSSGVGATIPNTSPDTTLPTSFATIVTMTVSSQELYEDMYGQWRVKASILLANVPVDSRRAYIQIQHGRNVGAVNFKLDLPLNLESGSVTIYVDDLIPYTPYVVQAVPTSYFGRKGQAGQLLFTTTKDGTAPAKPVIASVTPILRGFTVTMVPPTEIDFKAYELHVSTTSGFTPSSNTLKIPDGGITMERGDLTPGTTYYVKVIAYDTSGNKSEVSDQASVVAGVTNQTDIGIEIIDWSKIKGLNLGLDFTVPQLSPIDNTYLHLVEHDDLKYFCGMPFLDVLGNGGYKYEPQTFNVLFEATNGTPMLVQVSILQVYTASFYVLFVNTSTTLTTKSKLIKWKRSGIRSI